MFRRIIDGCGRINAKFMEVSIGQVKGHSYYHSPGVRENCHDVKQKQDDRLRNKAINQIAEDLVLRGIVQVGDILIPAPQHSGNAEYTKDIANIISEKTGAIVADVIKCVPHRSLYEQKDMGEKPTLNLYRDGDLPNGRQYFFVDNVISTGLTFRQANQLCRFQLKPLVYAIDETRSPELGIESNPSLTQEKCSQIKRRRR